MKILNAIFLYPTKQKIENNSRQTDKLNSINETNLDKIPDSYYNKIMVENINADKAISDKHDLTNYQGCLLGGAMGDALGWPIEFLKLHEIKQKYGSKGITDLKITHKGKSEITDDTQMTIFTADGLLKSAIKTSDTSSTPDMALVFSAYQNWLLTQGYSSNTLPQGWIPEIKGLYVRRAPGNTCLQALINGEAGSTKHPINKSAGCGGVMRVAPAGLMYYKNPELAFKVGAECAALTHSHPMAYLPAGVHSAIIANIIQGKSLTDAVDNSLEILKSYPRNEELTNLLEKAKTLSKCDISPIDAINLLGEGWVGSEAIAISVYCALKEPENFQKALIMAVNHNGDSDSTGAITGNILGAYLGTEKLPKKWVHSVELSDELLQLGKDLYNQPQDIENKESRYPIVD